MRIFTLQAGSRAPLLDLEGARGLVAFAADGEPLWSRWMATLSDAYASRGRFAGPGPLVEARGGTARMGTAEFEAALDATLDRCALHRDEYAAVWFGAGAPGAWLSAAWGLSPDSGPVRDARALGRPMRASRDGAGAWRALVRAARDDVERLAGADDRVERTEVRLGEARRRAEAAWSRARARRRAWVRERQDAETRLSLYRDRGRELRRGLESMDDADPETTCSTCGRTLGDRSSRVRDPRREEWESVVQDGRWWRRRRDQLEAEPAELESLESEAGRQASRVEDLETTLATRRRRAVELGAATVHLERLLEASEAMGSAGGGEAGPQEGESDARSRGALARAVRRARESVRLRIHAKAVALTGGRLASSFPGLYRDWSEGGRRGGEDAAALELGARLALVELAAERGLVLGSLVFPVGLERLRADDLRRAVEDLAALGSSCASVVVKASPDVVAAAPERFGTIYRLEDAAEGPGRITRRRAGMGRLRLKA